MDRTRLMGTCLHESGHAVVGHLLGAGLCHVAVLGESTGEALPECSLCRRCLQYYEQHNPAEDPHSQQIQDDLRRNTAIALAGESADGRLADGASATEAELVQDRYLARSRASAVHLWKDARCYQSGGTSSEGECSECDAFIASVRERVGGIIDDSRVSTAVVALAEHLAARQRLSGIEVSEFLSARGLNLGSVPADALPAAPK